MAHFINARQPTDILRIPITKVDVEKREVWGIAAVEEPDRSGEILDYASSKGHFEAWSKSFSDATNGKSLGNLRAMHTKIAAGKLIAFAPNDAAKCFEVGTKVVDDQEWSKVLEGVYTGFSIGGSYLKSWADPNIPALKRYTARPSELSLVDSPCIPSAQFTVIKADGISELRKFAVAETLQDHDIDRLAKAVVAQIQKASSPATLTKVFDGDKLLAKDFAYAPDATQPATWVLPIGGSTVEKSVGNIRVAIANFHEVVKGIPSGQRLEVATNVLAAAKNNDVPDAEMKECATKMVGSLFSHAIRKLHAGNDMAKGMWDVSRFADLLSSLAYMADSLESEAKYENDDSPLPARMRAVLPGIKQIFIDLAIEEANELIHDSPAAATAKVDTSQTIEKCGNILSMLKSGNQPTKPADTFAGSIFNLAKSAAA